MTPAGISGTKKQEYLKDSINVLTRNGKQNKH
jgi:hypothetical protein